MLEFLGLGSQYTIGPFYCIFVYIYDMKLKCVHLLLQYGVKIFILTSFRDTCYIEILPVVEKSRRGNVYFLI